MDLVLVVFLLVIDHENVIGILGVFGTKNQRYCECMDNQQFRNTSKKKVSAFCTLYL